MGRQLTEMSLDELWELFPIVLKEHNPNYPEWYEDERAHILSCVEDVGAVRISHIGSTAVVGLLSKPTVDILLEVDTHSDIPCLVGALETQGWLPMSSEYEPELRLAFNKGYTLEGFAEKTCHLHVRHRGDWGELYFRDYLLAHPKIALEYGNLKLSLLESFEHDRDGYTEAKTSFITEHTKKARMEYPNRYRL
ncbi:MAG: GrpB family protein [Coriobacteriales bacterium]|jgi:GrpB-like predicted nucleotidyltransferase (UPF0157 family)|nr:GrpB family protein [Coriobacteriales bacterium]